MKTSFFEIFQIGLSEGPNLTFNFREPALKLPSIFRDLGKEISSPRLLKRWDGKEVSYDGEGRLPQAPLHRQIPRAALRGLDCQKRGTIFTFLHATSLKQVPNGRFDVEAAQGAVFFLISKYNLVKIQRE